MTDEAHEPKRMSESDVLNLRDNYERYLRGTRVDIGRTMRESIELASECVYARANERAAFAYIRALEQLVAQFDGHVEQQDDELYRRYQVALELRETYDKRARVPDAPTREADSSRFARDKTIVRRTCDVCGKTMPLIEFYPIIAEHRRNNGDERETTCRHCVSAERAPVFHIQQDLIDSPSARLTLRDRLERQRRRRS